MGAIAGMLAFGGAPADRARVETLTEAQQDRGPDAGGLWHRGPVALGHRALWTTPEAAHEPQPVADAAGGRAITFDGRIDNRDELFEALGVTAAERAGVGDAGLMLRSLDAWGEAALRRVVGDFAFALWDARQHTLTCARDILGLRPLHYTRDAQRFVFASTAAPLARGLPNAIALNEGFVAEHLAWSISSQGETALAGVLRLPAAHLLTVDRDGELRLRRYWDVDFGAELRYADEAQYAEHLRALLHDSVRSRLRARGAVAVQLSGGVDSSAVAALAAGLARAPGGARVELRPINVAYPGLACDEGRFADRVARHLGLALARPAHVTPPSAALCAPIAQRLGFPGYPMSIGQLSAVNAAARDAGCRVVLTGEGGDELFAGEPSCLAGLLLAPGDGGRLAALRDIAGAAGVSPATALRRYAIRPLLERAWLRFGLPPRGRHPAWIVPRWARAVGLDARLRAAPRDIRGAPIWKAGLHRALFSPHNLHFYELTEDFESAAGIELRHPLLDRRVIEFAFALPPALHMRDGWSKHLLRHALAGWLPREVIERRDKAEFSDINVAAIDAVLASHPARRWASARAGWIDPARLDAMYTRSRDAKRQGVAWRGLPTWIAWTAFAYGELLDEVSASRVDRARLKAPHR